jgi:small subunit ribosomal protein S20
MAITKSAKKAARQSLKRKAQNSEYKNKIKALVKEFRVLISEKKLDDAKKLLPKVYQALDKATKVNVLKKNTASRRKSRFTKLVDKK